ncbi:MAG: division/cell wall cluster transcriptional repressor MraZ [bacterium]
MLRGASALNLDAKGRLAIPGRYRDQLAERCEGRMVVTVNADKEHCLWMYPLDAWHQAEEKVVGLPSFDPAHQRLKRFFIGYANPVEMDKSGRVLLPAPLREFALIAKAVCLIGQGNKFEVWDEALWNARRDQWLREEIDPQRISPELEQLTL